MVKLSNWKYDGQQLWGICEGHPKLFDGTYIHTSLVMQIESSNKGLDVYTYSGTHYHLQVEEISIDDLELTKESLKENKIDISFLDNVKEEVERLKKEKEKEVDSLIGENDLYIEFIGMTVKNAFFKKDSLLIPLECHCHVGMFQDSYLIRKPEVVDVRYFDKYAGVDFYHVSDGINKIYFKYTGQLPFMISGIGNGLKFEKNDTEIKVIKAENCSEGLVSPDVVNGKSLFFPMEIDEEFEYNDEEKEVEHWGKLDEEWGKLLEE